MHLKTTFLMLLALVAAAAVLWIGRGEREVGSRPPAARRLLEFKPETITYLSFFREGEYIECVREQDQWLLRKPVAAPAAAAEINRLLAEIAALPRLDTITPAQRQVRELTLEHYGLVKPRARIVLGDALQRRTLLVGDDAPLRDSVYVRLDDEAEVVATATNLLALMPRRAADIRDRRLLHGSRDYVRRLEIKKAHGPLLQLVKEGEAWELRQPELARADWERVARWLELLFTLEVRDFVTDSLGDPAAYGLTPEEAWLQVGVWQDQDQAGVRLLFGRPAPGAEETVYAVQRNSSSLTTVNQALVAALAAAAEELRDARLYFMAPNKIGLIRIESGERKLELRREADAWVVGEPVRARADTRAVVRLLDRLNSFRAAPVAAAALPGAAEWQTPGHVIRLAALLPVAGAAGEPAEDRTLILTAPRPGQEYVFARFTNHPAVYRVSALSGATISLDPLHYLDGSVFSLDPAAVRRITLQTEGREQGVEQDAAGVWRPCPPATNEVSPQTVSHLLARLADLQAVRFERSDVQPFSFYGLDPPRAALTLTFSGAEAIQKTLLFGDRSDDQGVYAMFRGQDRVFVIAPDLAAALTGDLLR